jgi:DNA invertase Pin-like site-specific DNA recombinase
VTAYAYVRLSQGEDDSLGLEAQRQAVLGRYPNAEIREEIKSGARAANRPELQRLLAELRRGDVLMIMRLDRLTRSLTDFASLVERARRGGWSLVSVTEGFDMATDHGEMLAGVLAVFAQYERRLISTRTRAGLAVARERGWDPRRTHPRVIPAAVRRRIARLRAAGLSQRAIAAEVGLHRTTVVRVLEQRT